MRLPPKAQEVFNDFSARLYAIRAIPDPEEAKVARAGIAADMVNLVKAVLEGRPLPRRRKQGFGIGRGSRPMLAGKGNPSPSQGSCDRTEMISPPH
jgi:hypothetical protein